MGKEWEPDSLLDVLGSGLAWRILVKACRESLTAEELAERSGASRTTVYRRINALVEYGLLSEEMAVNPEGNNYRTYETDAESIHVTVTPDGIETAITEDRDLVDRFEAFWMTLEEGGAE